MLDLPYVDDGPFAREWGVRARTFERFVAEVIEPRERAGLGEGLRILDLGAGNGWLSLRLVRRGHRAVALDLRTDGVDGLGAAGAAAQRLERPLARVAGSFEAIPLPSGRFDVVVYNAALHYAVDLERALSEAVRVARPGAQVAILDSPFYPSEEAGASMMEEKRGSAREVFGELADDLLALPFVEFLTRERLEAASPSGRVVWRRHRVPYPLWYELRPLKAWLTRSRRPSRFDLWVGEVG